MAVSVTYNLAGAGWAECFVEVGEQRAHVTASYLSDALRDLLQAVVDLLRGLPETTAVFAEEPGEYRWRFHRVSEDRLLVRIFRFPDWLTHLLDERGEVVLEVECRLRTFAGAVLATSQRVLREHGEEGYLREWINHPFPMELQVYLKRLLDEGAGRTSSHFVPTPD